jgi:hypothetical protein
MGKWLADDFPPRMMLSSANSLSWLDFIHSDKSFIYTRKRTGPRTVPWGTPEVTGTISDDSPSRTTVCVRFDKKAEIHYMIFYMASDILDPVKPNYCPLFKNLLQIQIKIFKPISLSWTLPKPLTKFHINDFYANSNFMESNIKLDLCLFIKP